MRLAPTDRTVPSHFGFRGQDATGSPMTHRNLGTGDQPWSRDRGRDACRSLLPRSSRAAVRRLPSGPVPSWSSSAIFFSSRLAAAAADQAMARATCPIPIHTINRVCRRLMNRPKLRRRVRWKHRRPRPSSLSATLFAEWLGYGLEEAFTDTPEIGIVRKIQAVFGSRALRGGARRGARTGRRPSRICWRRKILPPSSSCLALTIACPCAIAHAGKGFAARSGCEGFIVGSNSSRCGQARGRAAAGRGARAQGSGRHLRISHRQVGGTLRQAHRRDDHRAQVQGRPRAVGRIAGGPRCAIDQRHELSR